MTTLEDRLSEEGEKMCQLACTGFMCRLSLFGRKIDVNVYCSENSGGEKKKTRQTANDGSYSQGSR